MAIQTIEIQAGAPRFTNLPKHILDGDIFLVKNCLQENGLFDILEQATFSGIRNHLGEEIANKVHEVGVEKIHTVVSAIDIPDLTDTVYEAITPQALGFL